MAYAVIAEKYTHNAAEQVDTSNELSIPLHTGNVPCKMLLKFSRKCVLGSAVNPFVSSECDLVELINST